VLRGLLIETSDLLLAGEERRVFNGVGKKVVHLLEAEILAIVISLRHLLLI
jgi:hypothetical protein